MSSPFRCAFTCTPITSVPLLFNIKLTLILRFTVFPDVVPSGSIISLEKKYRLKLRGEYNEVLKQLIDNLPIRGGVKASKHWNSKNNSNEVLRMYNSFYGKLNNENIYDIWNSVRKVQIVDVQCEDKDNPQRVFDCINSTGVPLRLFEQIKNGTLMEYEEKEQIRLYYKYWEPLISYFKHKVGKFDEFFVMILRYLKQGKVTGSKNMGYIYFKRYMEENNLSSEDFLIMVLNIFNYYKIFNGDESSGDAEIDAAFENLVIFNASATIFPVLLSLYTYYDKDISYKPDLLNCLKLLETQLMRGVICGRRAYNVLKRFDLSVIDNRNLLQSLIKGFKMLDTSFISDADFKRGLNRNREWYNGSMKRVTNGFLKRKNADLWKIFIDISKNRNIKFVWVKGHADNFYNKKCDLLAKEAIKSHKLY